MIVDILPDLDSETVHRLCLVLRVKDKDEKDAKGNPIKTGSSNVSFFELVRLYNERFGIGEDPYQHKFVLAKVNETKWHIAQKIVDS